MIFVLNRTSSDRIRLDVHAQEDLQGFARKSLYQPVDHQEACDPSPYEEHKYWLEGTVLAVEQATYWAQTTRYTVQATDGHLYELRNSYALHPYRLEEGKAHRFYGTWGTIPQQICHISISPGGSRWIPAPEHEGACCRKVEGPLKH